MKKLSESESWILNSGAWVVLVISAFLGIIGTEAVVDWKTALGHNAITVARLTFSVLLAIGIVYTDKVRGISGVERIKKRIRLPQRTLTMFSAGCASVVMPLAAWRLILFASQEIAKWIHWN